MLEGFFQKLGRFQAKRSLPRYHGHVHVPDVHSPVDIWFDGYRVPHIRAERARELFFAQGYVHAMERMWQMEFTRRVAAGRLAETFGNLPVNWRDLTVHLRDTRLVDVDHFLRTLRLMWASERSVAALDDHSRSMLEAYCDGVNAWLMTRPHRRLPVEFRLLGLDAVPWTPVDAVSVAKSMAYHLNFAWKTTLVQAAIGQILPEAMAAQLLPEGYAPHEPIIVSRAQAEGLLETDEAVRDTLGWRGTGLGSDSWVLSGSRTESGKPLLANDPHLRLRAPCVWYLTHLEGDGYDVQGASLPGMPGVVLGRTPTLAWGVTAAMLHDADIYIERLDENRPDFYQVGDDWQKLEVIEEEIKIRDSLLPIHRTVRVSRHGPLLSDALPRHSRDAHRGLALRWIAHEPTVEVAGVMAVNRARTREDLREALRLFACPAQNFVYADTDGNIGYQLAGWIPIRRKGKGQLPVPGWTDEYDWSGYVPFEENPHEENPESGYIATANNQIAGEDYPYFISHLWEPAYRIRRIHELIRSRQKHSVTSACRMQADLVSLQATDFMRDVIRPFVGSPESLDLSHLARHLLELITHWDGACSTESKAAAAFHVVQYQLLLRIFGERLGEDTLLAYLEHFNESLVKLDKIMAEEQSEWFGKEGRNGAVASALEASARWLGKELGPETAGWTWGRLHQTIFEHPIGGQTFSATFFNLGPYPTPGSIGTLNAGQFFYAYPFRHYVGASYRHVIDLSDANDSHYVLHTGQSGNPLSSHYRDQVDLWLSGQYVPMRPSSERTRLQLVPEAPPEAVEDDL